MTFLVVVLKIILFPQHHHHSTKLNQFPFFRVELKNRFVFQPVIRNRIRTVLLLKSLCRAIVRACTDIRIYIMCYLYL